VNWRSTTFSQTKRACSRHLYDCHNPRIQRIEVFFVPRRTRGQLRAVGSPVAAIEKTRTRLPRSEARRNGRPAWSFRVKSGAGLLGRGDLRFGQDLCRRHVCQQQEKPGCNPLAVAPARLRLSATRENGIQPHSLTCQHSRPKICSVAPGASAMLARLCPLPSFSKSSEAAAWESFTVPKTCSEATGGPEVPAPRTDKR